MRIDDLAELTHAWGEIREDYDTLSDDEYDRRALDCAAALAADPNGETAYVWTLGLVLMAPYLAWSLDGTGKPEAVEALRATDRALRDQPCAHDEHPYLEHEKEADLFLPDQILGLADPAAEWEENHTREEWLCPRNVAGFARIALDILEPGSVQDVPPRLPAGAEDAIETLTAVLHGYPRPGTDLDSALTSPALDLADAAPEDLPGHLLTVRAVTAHVTSGAFDDASVLDALIRALEATLPRLAAATCDHGHHTEPPRGAPALAELGIVLASPGGRARYALRRREGRDAPLEELRCPVFLASIAEKSLDALRTRRAQLV
ncbi:hypothetical protein LX15_005043 [Streptoalloteichus tenebrarius]|uniref:Uncharacterized protein n=1 Tax=Streptoalloteichus tenebrarius (strain ATCC 17920 / DSM 40477 / JCM 4838 / CBS 697.72 / NBRC 16177 / NCIMB 11028 / NRRL B-12390 / A12253. 1 / ISP 5477) TaxID=1933 RepID=A0ABT1I0L6_STRSD|nr:hypothetical protein [Streptoalloteichus tenebrarius]MCP2261322.1 hypothetical protein [Streptoalloteichus tenebrarius]BFF03722.1 hypothetical protein GCM10020241_53970 [Streptoalloteichus tenebrarius]